MHHLSPEYFDDSLKHRTLPYKWRRVGNPFRFLQDVGILAMLEFIYKGNTIVDVAQELNIGVALLSTWLENEGHLPAVEEAEKVSAEGYLAEGHKLLRCAASEFELKKAKEMISHARFMASKKDRSKYGSDDKSVPGAGVTFVINMGENKPQDKVVKTIAKAKEASMNLAFSEEERAQLGALPDVGPFFEDFEALDLDNIQAPKYIKDCK